MDDTRYQTLPHELKTQGSFCLWKREERNGRTTKIPYNPRRIGELARSNDRTTFAPLYWAQGVLKKNPEFDGIGVGIFDNISAIDIDHCVQDGEISEMAADIMLRMDSYTEYSPSGNGIRILFRASAFSYDKETFYVNHQEKGLEVYVEGATNKYVTVTGNTIGSGRGLEERGDVLAIILNDYMKRPAKVKSEVEAAVSTDPVDITDQDLLDKARESANGHAFSRLYDTGDLAAYSGDHSAADMALCNMLAFWTGRDAERMDDLFRRSALMREKWDRPTSGSTYGAITIGKAIDGCTEIYTFRPQRDDEKSTSAEDQPQPAETEVESVSPEQEEYKSRNSAAAYMDQFNHMVEDRAARPAIPTGFQQLDTVLDGGLFDGLYILGAISSLGKTTFALQIADSIAASGRDVLLFSLEMSKFELSAKSLSRQTFILDKSQGRRLAKTTRGILNGSLYRSYSQDERVLIEQARSGYIQTCGGHTYILEGNGDIGPKEVRKAVEEHTRLLGASPVVVLDYLQILKPSDVRASDKQNTDWAVSELKRISREYQIPILAISSLNRENYHTPINLTSFKESGAIEYSSDVLIGLQVKGADEYKENCKAQNHKDTEEKKRKDPREIELKILKNRNGQTGSKMEYRFYPQFNFFEEVVHGVFGSNR